MVHYIGVLVFLMTSIPVSFEYIESYQQGAEPCMKCQEMGETREMCGVCGRHVWKGDDGCLFIYDYRFKITAVQVIGDVCYPRKQYCFKDTCKNEAPCLEGFGVERCICSQFSLYYGMHCEYRMPEPEFQGINPYPVGIQVFLDLRVNLLEKLYILIASTRRTSDMLLIITTQWGNVKVICKPDAKKRIHAEYVKLCKELTILGDNCEFLRFSRASVYITYFIFPKTNILHPGLVYFGTFPVGYTNAIHVLAYNIPKEDWRLSPQRLPVFNNTYPVFVEYPKIRTDINCYPDIYIKNCELAYGDRRMYIRSDEFTISIFIFKPPAKETCTKATTYMWEFWKGKQPGKVYVIPYMFQEGKFYNFTVVVGKQGLDNVTIHQIVSVATSTVEAASLVCGNCIGTNLVDPKGYVYLYLVGSHPPKLRKEMDYIWEYSKTTNTDYKSAEDIRVPGTKKALFVIKENKLEDGSVYFFRVSEKKTKMSVSIQIKTPEVKKSACTIQPLEGIAGLTLFNINCKIANYSGLSYAYEFYDKSPKDEPLFSGRMVGSSSTGLLENFRLTKGKLVMCSYGTSKLTYELEVPVKLSPFNGTVADIDSMIALVDELLGEEAYGRLMGLVSAIPDVLTTDMKREQVFGKFVSALSKVPLDTMADVKFALSSLQNILETMSKKFENFTMEASVAKNSADVVLKVATEVVKRNRKIVNERTLTPTILHQMIRAVFDCVQFLMAEKNIEVRTKPEEYVNPVILDLVQMTSFELVSTLEQVSFALLRQQMPGDTYKEINSTDAKLSSWVKVDPPTDLYNLTSSLKNFPLTISQDMAESVETLTDELGVQFIQLKINPFWWAGGNIDTDVTAVTFCFKRDMYSCRFVSILKHPIQLHFDIASPVASVVPITGTTSQLDPEMSEDDLDLGITVYRFDPPLRARLFFTFLFENGTNTTFRVLVLKNLRPYYEIMKEEGVEISPKSPVYNLAYDPSDTDKFYFMGILPGKEHPILSTLNFTFTTYYTHCRTWLKWQWTSDGCWVGDKTSAPTLVCECSHLSLFAGTVQVPPHDLNTVIQFPLFLTSPYNIVPLIVLLIFLLLYLLLCLWGRHRDKKDKSKVDVIVLEDNYPGERFAYLLGVYTGSRINASSDAHVGVRLSGEDLDSRPHILKTSSRTTLRGNSDDWFLLYSNHHLGMLNYLQIWHDDSGSSPDWFVERVEVYDLEDKIEYLFELNVWIALEVDEYPEAMVAPARMDQFFSVKSVFLSNIVSGLRDTHYWTSILWRHPRNAVTRVERIQVVMCFIMVAMLVSLLLFCFSNRIYMPYLEDDPSFSIKGDDVLIFFTSFVAASLSACLVMVLFRKSYSHKYIRADKSLFLRSSRLSEAGTKLGIEDSHMSRMSFKHAGGSVISLVTNSSNSSKLSRFVELPRSNLNQNFIRYNMKTRLASERTTYQNFVLALHSIVRGTPLTPVTLPNSKSSLILHKKYFCAAWCLCVVIIVLCAIPVSTIGWKLPPVKNEEWLFIFLGVLVFDAFIVSTFKILLFSAILGFMFQRMVPATTHNVRAKDGAQIHLKGDMDHLEKLADIRCKPWYCPLSDRMKVVSPHEHLG